MIQRPIRLSLSLAGTAALALASLPFDTRLAVAQEAPAAAAAEPKGEGTEAADPGVMDVNLRDAVKFNWGFQGALQGAGTPNQAGIGAFIPLSVSSNSVFFLDTLANVNFSDFSDYSSIINTKVKGATVSTSTRLGYRWLNKNRSWMFGVNAGYDSRPLATGGTDNGVPVTDSQTVFFQQVALNLEAVSNKWFTSAYLLYPIGEYGYNKTPAKINDYYYADSVMTVGADIGYNLTPRLKASVGYYYSEGDAGAADGNSVRGRLEYTIANGLTSGINIAYDPAYSEGYSSGEFYKTLNLSVDLKWRFGANGYGAPSIRKQQPVVMPVIQALSTTPANRDIRVHDSSICDQPIRNLAGGTKPYSMPSLERTGGNVNLTGKSGAANMGANLAGSIITIVEGSYNLARIVACERRAERLAKESEQRQRASREAEEQRIRDAIEAERRAEAQRRAVELGRAMSEIVPDSGRWSENLRRIIR